MYDVSALVYWYTQSERGMVMKDVRVVYATKTKHSKKIAEAIGKELGTKAINVTDNPSVEKTELLFIIGGIYGGDSLPELLGFVDRLDPDNVKRVALVTSCASKSQGQENVRKRLEEKGIDVIDERLIQGSFLLYKLGRPNKADIQEAVDFARTLQERL